MADPTFRHYTPKQTSSYTDYRGVYEHGPLVRHGPVLALSGLDGQARGTVALWTKSSLYCRKPTPQKKPVDPQRQQGAESSEPYRGRDFGSLRASREQHYTSLGMPWPAASPVAAFAQALSVRRGWNRGGKLESGQADFYGGSSATTLADLANSHDGGKNTPSTLAPTVIVWYRRVMRLRRLWGQETRQQGWEVPRPCCYLLGAGPAAWH
ncbi:S-adenosyl-L-methionine-dependent methyltransferase [Apiospora kogelbergensis]|uniref:S-adenosyl-L-methionine-dependent methyltransferase n=1 Tax=Apiospora kogelbergensis TaxID=1337665 RepID=A0AAW0QBE0_9PEZI